jgi:fused signal recognition particle receptor
MGFFSKTLDKLKGAVRKTAQVLNTDVRTLFVPGRQINEQFLAEMEERLMQADMGVQNVDKIMTEVRERWRLGRIRNAEDCLAVIKEQLLSGWEPPEQRELNFAAAPPTVILVCGINGAGKTTSIAKLAWLLKNELHKKVIVCASDTFRAAAVEQLTIWADRIGVEIIKHKMGADPGAVAYDACEAAKSRAADVLIVDTAGRLHTKFNLMEELRKIFRVLAKQDPNAPEATLLVLDATTGQNALSQAREFQKTANVTGLILAKIDGTAKGGAVFPIVRELKVPILFLGSGEKLDDLEPFDAKTFVDALLLDR